MGLSVMCCINISLSLSATNTTDAVFHHPDSHIHALLNFQPCGITGKFAEVAWAFVHQSAVLKSHCGAALIKTSLSHTPEASSSRGWIAPNGDSFREVGICSLSPLLLFIAHRRRRTATVFYLAKFSEMVRVMALNDGLLTAAICHYIINLVDSPFAEVGFGDFIFHAEFLRGFCFKQS